MGVRGRRFLAAALGLIAVASLLLAVTRTGAAVGGLLAAAVFGGLAVVAWTWDRLAPESMASPWLTEHLTSASVQVQRELDAYARMTPAERRAAFLRERGFHGRVTVLAARATGQYVGDDPVYDVDLVVHDPRWEPYRVTRREVVPAECVGRLAYRASFFAHIHPETRESLLVEWNVRAIA